MIAFACPGCGEKLKVKDDLAGKRGKCPRCRSSVLVPGGDARENPGVSGAAFDYEAATLAPSSSGGSVHDTAVRIPGDAALGASGSANPLTDFLAPAQQPD